MNINNSKGKMVITISMIAGILLGIGTAAAAFATEEVELQEGLELKSSDGTELNVKCHDFTIHGVIPYSVCLAEPITT